MNKNIVLSVAVILVIIALGLLFYSQKNNAPQQINNDQNTALQRQTNTNQEDQTNTPSENKPQESNTADNSSTATPAANQPDNKTETVIGKSAGNRNIYAYHYGQGKNEILVIGGIHGGYSTNTSILAYQLMDYLKTNPDAVPDAVKITVIPVLNPDGLSKVVSISGPFKSSDVSASANLRISGRFNSNNVDLNRNFDCDWKATGIWQNKTVSGGTKAFSEPESAAIRDYAQANKIATVIAWYSSGGGVFSSNCGNGILPETKTITDLYAAASGYAAHNDFNYYQVNGDMTNWFAKQNTPAIGVILSTADSVDLNQNLAGIKALLSHYSK